MLGLLGRTENEQFRNPNSVFMKLCNFPRFDPDYHFVLIGGVSPEQFPHTTGIEIVEKALSLAVEKKFS